MPQDDYAPAWADLRRRRRGFAFSVLGTLLSWGLAAACIATLNSLAETPALHSEVWLGFAESVLHGILWLAAGCFFACWVAFLVFAFRAMYFSCPRCGRAFFVTWLYSNPFSTECLHCGLLHMPGARAPGEGDLETGLEKR